MISKRQITLILILASALLFACSFIKETLYDDELYNSELSA
jgi:hypothetical protein